MYNSKPIDSFIDKVTAEAEKAAQAIFDKYESELIRKIKAQLQPGDKINVGMGVAGFTKDTYSGYAEDFLKTISATQYPHMQAGFCLTDIEHDETVKVKELPVKPKIVPITPVEKKVLLSTGNVKVRMKYAMPASKSSIIYGIGYKRLWDRIERIWVYGDTEKYKVDRMNVGRRSTDYPDNKASTLNGIFWWEEFNSTDTPKGLEIGEIVKGGYKVENIQVVKIETYPIYEITLSACTH